MTEFILEVFSEEIPHQLQENAAKRLASDMASALSFDGQSIKFENFHSSRRIVVYSHDASLMVQNRTIKGPAINSDSKAIEGFARKIGINKEKLCQEDGVFVATIDIRAKLASTIERCLQNFSWPKSVAWDNSGIKWIRPIRNILCLLDNQPISVRLGDITANNETVGHRLSKYHRIVVKSIDQYISDLRTHMVIVDQKERAGLVSKAVRYDVDQNMHCEAINSAEWPNVIECAIDTNLLNAEAELTNIALRSCNSVLPSQKTGYFFVVTDNPSSNEKIKKGYERAVNTKLDDLLLLWRKDMALPESALREQLQKMQYHEKLGNYQQKLSRIVLMAKYIALLVAYAHVGAVEEVALVSKLDMPMAITREYPELQGLVAAAYIGTNHDALRTYNKIMNHADLENVPYNPTAIVLVLSDIIDTVVGFFGAGQKPTTSRDPFGLKRMIDVIIRAILHYNLDNIHILLLIRKSIAVYAACKTKGANKWRKVLVADEVLSFVMERFATTARMRFSHDVCAAVLVEQNINNGNKYHTGDDNLVCRWNKLSSVAQFKDKNFLTAYRRASNIVNKANIQIPSRVSRRLLRDIQEKRLFVQTQAARTALIKALNGKRFEDALSILSNTGRFVADFFDADIRVNVNEQHIKMNRLALLYSFVKLADLMCNFDLIAR